MALALHFHSSSYLVEIQEKIMELSLRGPKPHMRMAELEDRRHPRAALDHLPPASCYIKERTEGRNKTGRKEERILFRLLIRNMFIFRSYL